MLISIVMKSTRNMKINGKYKSLLKCTVLYTGYYAINILPFSQISSEQWYDQLVWFQRYLSICLWSKTSTY